MLSRSFVRFLLSAATITCLAAQTPTSSLLGFVSDVKGAVVPAAAVQLRNTATNSVQSFTTDSTGLYRFTALVTGTYELSVVAPGFQRFVESNINITAAAEYKVDVQLQLGEVTSTVVVTAQSEKVDSESSTLRDVVDQKRVSDLPLNGRDITSLVLLVPGTVYSPMV